MLEPGAEYPKAAYRLGSQTDVWGRMMDIRRLVDGEDEAVALVEGWSLHPLDVKDGSDDAEPKRRGRPPKVKAEDVDHLS